MVAESVDLLFGESPLVLHGGRKAVERLEGCGQAVEVTQRVAVQGPECIRVVGWTESFRRLDPWDLAPWGGRKSRWNLLAWGCGQIAQKEPRPRRAHPGFRAG